MMDEKAFKQDINAIEHYLWSALTMGKRLHKINGNGA